MPDRNWKFDIAGSVVTSQTTAILEGFSTSGVFLRDNINSSSTYSTFSPTIGLMVPISTISSYSFSGIANVGFIPINSTTATGVGDPTMKLSGSRIDYTVGVDFSREYNSNKFIAFRAGAGIAQEFFSYTDIDPIPGTNDSEKSDSTAYRPFVMLQANYGKTFSSDKNASVFIRYEKILNNEDILLAAEESYLKFRPESNVLLIGLELVG